MKCNHCKKDFKEKDIEEHHIHPKFMDNSKGIGKKVQLCGKCHNTLHGIISKQIFYSLNESQRKKAVEKVKQLSLWWSK